MTVVAGPIRVEPAADRRSAMLVVTPNLCFDVTVRLPGLVPGSVLRATSTVTTAGGKGVNVARASRSTDHAVDLVGFVPQQDGSHLESLLADEHIDLRSVRVPGAVRVATIMLERSGRATVVNGPGPQLGDESWQALRSDIDRLVRTPDRRPRVVACSGSLPPGIPADAYGQVVALAHRVDVPVVVDASAHVLAEALPTAPDLVCPNLPEAETVLHGRADERVEEEGDDIRERALDAARTLCAKGAGRAAVTAGGSGAALATTDEAWWMSAFPVEVANPIGAGDAFVAGAASALAAGAGDREILERGMAYAAASCEQAMAGVVDPARVSALGAQAEVTPVAGHAPRGRT